MEWLNTIGWRVTGLRNRLSDQRWERQLGINTVGSVEVDRPDANRYATFAHDSIDAILDRLSLVPDDVFVDIGCGKGRVVCRAARRMVRQVIGIDIDAGLCEVARRNASIMKQRRSSIEIINLPAQEFDYRECTAFFLFNSFGAATLAKVLESIEASLRKSPRGIRFAYINPFHEHLLQGASWLRENGRLQRRPWSGLKFDVSFWKSLPS